MRSNRITPYSLYSIRDAGEPTVDIVLRRGKKMGKWLTLIAGLPIGYLWLPLSCCFRSPVASVVFDNDPETPTDKFAENCGTIIYGAATVMTCGGCCLGCFGSFEPQDV
jgi:hypothetical protein